MVRPRCSSVTPAAALRITEFMASNAMTIADEDGAFSDWLELHNETAGAVSVGGCYLTDDPAALTRWQLPAVSIPAGGYLLVWASNKNRTNPAAPLHTNFALSAASLASQPTPPDPAGHDVDHYRCYRASPTAGRPKYFPRFAQASRADAFEHRDYGLGRARHLCAPVDHDGHGIKNPDGYLLCYPANTRPRQRASPPPTRGGSACSSPTSSGTSASTRSRRRSSACRAASSAARERRRSSSGMGDPRPK